MDNKKIDDFIEQVTESLEDDREIKLDVQQEVKAHILDTFEAKKEAGEDDEEALENTFKSFGSTEDIGGDLLKANHKRMKIRSLVNLFIKFALVPASVVLALYMCIFMRFPVIRAVFSETAEATLLNEATKGIFIITGDKTKSTKVLQQKAIWDSEPSNKIYHGNYITELIAEYNSNKNNANLQKTLGELKKAKDFESQNARYDYLICGLLLEKAVTEIKIKKKKTWKVNDFSLLEKAMQHLRDAQKKEYYKTYSKEMLECQFKLLPEKKHIEDLVRNFAMNADLRLFDLTYLRKIAKVIPFYAERLLEKGENKKAKTTLDCWYGLTKDLESNSFTLVEVLVVSDIASIGEKYPDIYKNMGNHKAAQVFEKNRKILLEPVMKRFPRGPDKMRQLKEENNKLEEYLKQHSSILAWMLFPALGSNNVHISDKELAIGRELDYIIFERLSLNLLILFYMLAVIILCLGIIYNYFVKRRNVLLLLPGWQSIFKILLTGVLLPLGIYIFYTRFTYFGGREFNIIQNFPRICSEYVVIITITFSLIFSLLQRYVIKRSFELGLSDGRGYSKKRQKIDHFIWVSIFVLLIILPTDWTPIPAIIILIQLICNAILHHKNQSASDRRRMLYPLVLISSIAIIILSLVFTPILEFRERKLIKTDPIFKYKNGMLGFTTVESKIVQDIKRDYQKAFEEIAEENSIN